MENGWVKYGRNEFNLIKNVRRLLQRFRRGYNKKVLCIYHTTFLFTEGITNDHFACQPRFIIITQTTTAFPSKEILRNKKGVPQPNL